MAFLTHDATKKNFISTQFRGGYDEPEVVEFPELVSLTPIAQPAEAADEAEPDSTFGEAPLRTWDETGLAVAPTAVADEGAETVEGDAVPAAGSVSAVGLLALAQKLHEEFVAEGQSTRERLISEGQSHHDQVVGDATVRHDELLSTGQAKYDELVSVGEAKHDEFVSIGEAKHEALVAEATALVSDANAEHEHIIAEARELSAGMVAQAKQEKSEVLHQLGGERSLLKKEIEELRVLERDHRARLKSYLEGQLLELEHTGSDESTPAEGAHDVNQQNDGQRNDG